MEDYQQLVKFLKALDGQINKKYDLYIIGGSSITLTLDAGNKTEDIDVVDVDQAILLMAGRESKLAREYNVYIEKVSEIGFAAPSNWRKKAKQIDLGLNNLTLHCADIHDVILGKLARFHQKDVEDIMSLYQDEHLDIDYLFKRLNENKKELTRLEYRNNAKLAFKLIFGRTLIFREGQAKLG